MNRVAAKGRREARAGNRAGSSPAAGSSLRKVSAPWWGKADSQGKREMGRRRAAGGVSPSDLRAGMDSAHKEGKAAGSRGSLVVEHLSMDQLA